MLRGSWIHRNKFVKSLSTVISTVISLLQKQLAGSNLKGWLCIYEYIRMCFAYSHHFYQYSLYFLGEIFVLLNLISRYVTSMIE